MNCNFKNIESFYEDNPEIDQILEKYNKNFFEYDVDELLHK